MNLRSAFLAAAVLVSSCVGLGGQAARTPSIGGTASAARTATPALISGPFGVLATPPTGSGSYTVSIVGLDGRVVASASATSPPANICANSLPVSTSNSRVYFMNAQGFVRWLAPDGTLSAGAILRLPVVVGARTMFAVSPDDAQMAVVLVGPPSTNGPSTELFLYPLQLGGAATEPFNEISGYSLWPIGWHAANVVLGKVSGCLAGGGLLCCPVELHIVDPATAARRFTVGGPTCQIVGPPSPGGAVCETGNNTAKVLEWTGATTRTFALDAPYPLYISPHGQLVARGGGNDTLIEGGATLAMSGTCGWIDDTHLRAGAGPQEPPRIGDITTGNVIPIAALGVCAGRIPGGL